jgi:hypothetical protein
LYAIVIEAGHNGTPDWIFRQRQRLKHAALGTFGLPSRP